MDAFGVRGGEYIQPDTTWEAELSSFRWHAMYRDSMQRNVPDLERVSSWLELLVPVQWKIPDDFMTEAHFRRVLSRIWMDSSPGLPFMYTHATNAQVFGWDGISVDEDKTRLVWGYVAQRMESYVSDPIRIFIKQELHKASKVVDKRWRMISSVSLLDQIIDHMLFDEFNDAIIALDGYIQAGWNPSGGGWRRMLRRLGGGPYLAIDKSAWDWTMPGWVVDVDFELRKVTCENMDQRWLDLATKRYNSLYHQAVLHFSCGLRFQQDTPGLQKSGAVNTIITNSIGQISYHIAAQLLLGNKPDRCVPYALGDDTIQVEVDDPVAYAKALSYYGCSVKEATVLDKIEFAGRRIGPSGCEPLYAVKHFYNLLYSSEEHRAEMLQSYLYEYAHVSDGRKIALRELAKNSGVKGLTDRVLNAWMDGWDIK